MNYDKSRGNDCYLPATRPSQVYSEIYTAPGTKTPWKNLTVRGGRVSSDPPSRKYNVRPFIVPGADAFYDVQQAPEQEREIRIKL